MKYICTISLLICLYTGVQAQSNFGEVRGRIIYEKTALKNCSVTIFMNDYPVRESIYTDMFGMYYFKALNPGAYTITVAHPQYGRDTAYAIVTDSAISSVNFDLGPWGCFRRIKR